jgi:pimeloyl-ACP methyl ester carboxylesterase
MATISALTQGQQVLVGSSMGGWISLLVARAMPERVQGLVGIAAAPDFTEDWDAARLTPQQREDLASKGHFLEPSDHDPAGYPIGAKLIADGPRQAVLKSPLNLPFKVRLLHGTADTDVPTSVALQLLTHMTSPDARLTLVKDADHRFSTPQCLALIAEALAQVSG